MANFSWKLTGIKLISGGLGMCTLTRWQRTRIIVSVCNVCRVKRHFSCCTLELARIESYDPVENGSTRLGRFTPTGEI